MTKSIADALASFTFPLNAYAACVVWETGRLDYLHYGLYATPQATLEEAQARSSELVFAHLPKISTEQPPPRILEVGIGLGTTLHYLVSRGYDVRGITPDAAQVDYARDRYGESLPAEVIRFENFRSDQPFDGLLFQESAQYIEARALLGRAARLLKPGGELLILDEFALDACQNETGNLHSLTHFLDIAEAAGFRIVEKIDLTPEAAPTVATILDLLDRWRNWLIDDIGITLADIDHLVKSNEDYRQKYADGRYGYFLLRLRLETCRPLTTGLSAKTIDEAEFCQVACLYAETFERSWPEALWRWKYCDPLDHGKGCAIGLLHDEKLVAHCGTQRRAVRRFGQPQQAIQICDFFVDETSVSALPPARALKILAENHPDFAAGDLPCFGAAEERFGRLFAIGENDAAAARFIEIEWAAGGLPSLNNRVREVALADAGIGETIERLWTAMAVDLADTIVGERGPDYFDERYGRHPSSDYRFFLVSSRFRATPVALFVLAERGEAGVELVDIVAPLERFEPAIAQACRVALRLSEGKAQAPRLFCWTLEHQLARFAGGMAKPLPVTFIDHYRMNGVASSVNNDRWWLMGGDFDCR